jgi:hypothetical protein
MMKTHLFKTVKIYLEAVYKLFKPISLYSFYTFVRRFTNQATIRQLIRPSSFYTLLFTGLFSVVSHAAPSPLVSAFLSNIKGQYRITEAYEGTELSKFIDQTVLKILATPTGRLICRAIPADDYSIKNSVIINQSNMSEFRNVCRGQSPARVSYRPYKKRFFLIELEDSERQFDGWTNFKSETLIFVSRGEDYQKRIIRTLVHELVVSFDQKENIGVFGSMKFNDQQLVGDHKTCEMLTLIRNAKLKLRLTALRAFEFEVKVLQELGLAIPADVKQHLTEFSNAKSCEDKIRKIDVFAPEINRLSILENKVESFLDVGVCGAILTEEKNNELREMSAIEAAILLDRHELRFSGERPIKACDFFSRAFPFIPGTNLRGGPSPRLGGGGW